ncbi:MAG: TonB-dependent receptor [Pseudomonadota bacterium]
MYQFACTPSQLTLALIAAFCTAAPAWADAPVPVPDDSIPQIVVKSRKSAVPANSPATVETITAKEIAERINAVTSAEALNYLPSTHVRERYIGDRNGILVMRVNSSIASAQTTVYADNLLLSNFLNNSFSTAPRWGMVAPEEIERVEVMYGPFSPLYPGNSAGGVVQMSTHMPDQFEAHVKADLFGQRFKLYGTDQHFGGQHQSVSLGNKSGAWSFWLTADHLDNHSQPQTFGAATKATPKDAPAWTNVYGASRDIDTGGNPRIIGSAIGADHTIQDNGKFKLAYQVSPTLRATYTLGLWQNSSSSEVASYLRDAAGAPVYNTAAKGAGAYVKFAGDANYYTLAGVSPGSGESMHVMHGVALKSDTRGAWDWEVIASVYAQNKELSRSAANTGSLYDSGNGSVRPGGMLTVGDGTGWQNLDLRGEWRPTADGGRQHRLSFGYHADRYVLKSVTSAIAGDWIDAPATAGASSNSYGKTATQAVYLQDVVQLQPALKLLFGGRLEHWRAYDGSNFNAANVEKYRQLNYAERSSTDFSPKVSLSYRGDSDWAWRASLAHAVRYPTVAEIFQVISLPSNVKQNDPNLKAEKLNSAELMAERSFDAGMARASLFWEDKRDALISQTDTTVTPTISSIQNVDKVRTYGLEMVADLRDIWLRGLDLGGSATYTKSTIVEDRRSPALAGTDQPRIPDWRLTLSATYRASERLSYSLSYRYSGRQHNTLFDPKSNRYNDVNPNVYGAVSHYSVLDAKLLYKLNRQWTASLGVNNVGAFKYYVNPNPYPQRTFFTSVKFDY